MTCLSFYPRSATVRAVEETEVLELLRNVLQMLQKDKVFKADLDRRYRERALDTHLRTVPLLAGLSDAFVRRLRAWPLAAAAARRFPPSLPWTRLDSTGGGHSGSGDGRSDRAGFAWNRST